MKNVAYQKGFGNYFESECLPVLQSQNSPQAIPFGLYAEQLSGTAFTVPRHEQQRTWLYRIRPSVVHTPFIPYDLPRFCAVTKENSVIDPNQFRWNPIKFSEDVDFIHGVTTIAGQGNPGCRSGLAIHVYSFNKNMNNKAMNNSDGDFLFVLQEGSLSFRTEMGIIEANPGEIVVVQRGIRFSVDLCNGTTKARGYMLEVYDRHFELPELGPIGSNGLAYAHDFLYPTASYQDLDNITFEIYNKYQGKFFKSTTFHSIFDIVAWKGNYCPFKYDLKKFNTINTVSFDHPDPSIFTVLTVKSGQPGVALADFVIFPPR
jgi:homogentisate 1,2-dioxygenase